MSRFLKPILVEEKLREKNLRIFSLLEFQRLFGVSLIAAKKFTEKYCKRGFFVRLKKGLFVLKSNMPSEFEIANRVYQPSYISFEYALAYYQVIPEMVYAITSATTKPSRRFAILEKNFIYHTIKKQAFTGYVPKKIHDTIILIAEPEKAFVDYLYFVDLRKKPFLERVRIKKLSKKKTRYYVSLFKRKSLIDLLKKTL